MRMTFSNSLILAGIAVAFSSPTCWATQPPDPTSSDAGRNTAGGFGALLLLGTGLNNTAFGWTALSQNFASSNNTAVGAFSLNNNQGSNNTASGYETLTYNLGDYNTATGVNALFLNTASYNTADGAKALYSNTTGNNDTAAGFNALFSNTAGTFNTAEGVSALYSNTVGTGNTANGVQALNSNTIGNNNTAAGLNALYYNTAGSGNTAVGDYALGASTGSLNIAVGALAGQNLMSGNNNIYIGNAGANDESNTIRIGGGLHVRTYIAGIAGVAIPEGGSTVIIGPDGQLGTMVSSARYKQDIQDMGERSARLAELRPVTFRYKANPAQPQYGLIAEEVAEVYPDLVVRNADGRIESVQYHELIPMLLNELQKQQKELAALREDNANLHAELEGRPPKVLARLTKPESHAGLSAGVASR